MALKRFLVSLATFTAAVAGLAGAVAAAQPEPWSIGFQPPVTPTAERMSELNNLLLVVISGIVVFVLALLLYASWRYSEKRNPTPSRTTHNTVIEVLWTVIPVIILVIIAVPSYRLLYYADRVEEADMTIKAIGRQWYWSFEYPDHGNFTFDANMVPEEDLEPGQPRLLTTDYPLVLPVDTTIRVLVTASDVLHNFAVPAFGVRLDAVPGRLNETWVRVNEPGTYYGQCSELCGTGHAFMPIMVKAVPKDEYEAWVQTAQDEFARVGEPASQDVNLAKATQTAD